MDECKKIVKQTPQNPRGSRSTTKTHWIFKDDMPEHKERQEALQYESKGNKFAGLKKVFSLLKCLVFSTFYGKRFKWQSL